MAGARVRAREALVVTVLCGAMTLLATDSTIVTIANPAIQRTFHQSAATLQWTVTAYGLTFGGFLLAGGRLGDVLGRRRTFIWGALLFTAASLLAGAAPTMGLLVVCRAAQGLGGALVAPASLALIDVAFTDPVKRRQVIATWATAGSAGGLIGFVLGGLVTSVLGWRWIFYLNLPAGMLAVIGGLVWLPQHRPPEGPRSVDVPGAVLVTGGLSLLVFGLGQSQVDGWASVSTTTAFAVAVLALVAFVWVERRKAEPLLPLPLLLRREGFANVSVALQMMASMAVQFLNSIYMQQVFGYSAAVAGVATLPLPIGFAIGTRLGGRYLGRSGPRLLVTTGCLLIAAGIGRLTLLPDQGSYATTMLPAIGAVAIGLGLARVPSVVVATSGVDDDRKGTGAGLFNMFQTMGGSIGVAVLAAVATMATPAGLAGSAAGAAEAAGLRTAYVVGVAFALAAAAVALVGLSPVGVSPSDVVGDPGLEPTA